MIIGCETAQILAFCWCSPCAHATFFCFTVLAIIVEQVQNLIVQCMALFHNAVDWAGHSINSKYILLSECQLFLEVLNKRTSSLCTDACKSSHDKHLYFHIYNYVWSFITQSIMPSSVKCVLSPDQLISILPSVVTYMQFELHRHTFKVTQIK